MPTDMAPIQVFLSYARADDEEFGLVDPLVSKLKALVHVKSGRSLEVFVDRDSIGWGENWRDRLAESVENATVFIPLMTATYLARPACRDEFLAFHSKADVLGVTELLLPVLVFRSPLFNADNPDEVVKIAEALQYKCIEDGLLAGPASPEWLGTMRDLAEGLLDAISKAEAALGTLPVDPPGSGPVLAAAAPAAGDEDPTATDVAPGLAELMEAMSTAIDDMTKASVLMSPAMERLGEVADEVGALADSPTPQQLKVWTMALAHAFREPSVALEQHGRAMFTAAKRLDEAMIGMHQLAAGLEDPELSSPLTEGLSSVVENFGDLTEVAQSMEQLLMALKPAEALSVPLRKALQPARRGLTAVRDTIRLIEGWSLPEA